MVGVVSALTNDKQLKIEWTHNQSTGGPIVRHRERIDLSFWPTAVATLNENELLVAGKKPSNGKTILHHITLSLTDWPSENHPNTDTTEEVVLVSTTPLVKVLLAFPGREHSAMLIRTDGSVAAVDYVAKTVEELYAPQQYPLLARREVSMGLAAEHSAWGYVYAISCDHNVCSEGGVVMKDTNKDGQIDEVQELPLSEWIGNAQWVRVF